MLSNQIRDYVRAAFSGIWMETREPDEAQREIAKLCEEQQWDVHVWDIAQGFHSTGEAKGDPLAPLQLMPGRTNPGEAHYTLFLLHNYHRFFQNPMVVQALQNQLFAGKSHGAIVVVLSPVVQIPLELEKLFVVVEHPLPNTVDLREIRDELQPPEQQKDAYDYRAVDAATGLTRYEAEGAFALSLARHGEIKTETVLTLKAQLLKKTGLLEMYQGKETFDDLGGLDALKSFCERALGTTHQHRARPKGVLLLGVPGTGKSAFARALGNEVSRPTLLCDVGGLMGSLVGQTEDNVRRALRTADAMSPCVLFIDEIEKALAGVGSNGDSGVSTRLFGTLLTWLSDHTSEVFVVATSNDVSKLPPEFIRAERWDGIFFLDLPTQEDRFKIWNQYVSHYQIIANAENGYGFHKDPEADYAKILPDDANWTGAEIKACCRLAALLNVPLSEAAQYVVPVAASAPEKVSALREWAGGKCLSASQPGVFQTNHNPKPKARRKLTV